MIALQITATTPHGVVPSRPWGVALDGLLASVLWHRRKWAARVAGETFTYQHSQTPETLDLPLARCGDLERDADWHWMATFADLHPHPKTPPTPTSAGGHREPIEHGFSTSAPSSAARQSPTAPAATSGASCQ